MRARWLAAATLTGVVYACQAIPGSTAHSPSPVGTSETPRPTLSLASTTPPPAGPDQFGHPAWALEELLIATVATNDYSTYSSVIEGGANMLVDHVPKMFVAAACREPEDFSVAYLEPRRASGPSSATWSLTAYRVAGSDPETMSAAYLEVVGHRQDSPPTVSPVIVGGRAVLKVTIREQADSFFTSYAYAVGDVLFVWPSTDEQAAEEAILRLPPPGTDTSALGAPAGPAPDECAGPSDPALVSILPTEIEGQPMRRIWVTFFDLHTENPDDHASQFAAAVGATKYNFIGYLLAANLGHAVGAYRVVGADQASLLQGCAPLLYARPDWMEPQAIDGKDVLLAREPGEVRRVVGGCYVRDDVLFWVSGGNVPAYLQALP